MEKSAFMKSLRARMRSRLKVLGLSAAKASLKAGLSRNAIGEILSEGARGNRNPSIDTLTAIAYALEVDPGYWYGKSEAKPPQPSIFTIPVVGTAAAGIFKEIATPEPWLDEHDLERVQAHRSTRFPDARHFAFKVSGNSMNAAKPKPILDGEIALFVDLVDTNMEITDGKIYLVRRSRHGGQEYEFTLKRARRFKNRIELVPESTDPSFKPFVYSLPAKNSLVEGDEVSAVGLLYGMHYSFE